MASEVTYPNPDDLKLATSVSCELQWHSYFIHYSAQPLGELGFSGTVSMPAPPTPARRDHCGYCRTFLAKAATGSAPTLEAPDGIRMPPPPGRHPRQRSIYADAGEHESKALFKFYARIRRRNTCSCRISVCLRRCLCRHPLWILRPAAATTAPTPVMNSRLPQPAAAPLDRRKLTPSASLTVGSQHRILA